MKCEHIRVTLCFWTSITAGICSSSPFINLVGKCQVFLRIKTFLFKFQRLHKKQEKLVAELMKQVDHEKSKLARNEENLRTKEEALKSMEKVLPQTVGFEKP